MIPSLEWLIEQGYYVIRMGRGVTKKMAFEHPKFIPYDILNKGCKHRKPVQEKINTTKVVGYIMERFNGEIIDG